MSIWGLMIVLIVGASARLPGQDLPAPSTLVEAQQDTDYAELLNAARLTSEQLDALLQAQAAIQADTVLGPDEATALAEIRQGVLRGQSRDEALRALGDRQQAVGQAQQHFEQALQAQSKTLSGQLTEDQRLALARAATPVRALEGVVGSVSAMRALPDAQWQQVRTQMIGGIGQLSAQADPTAKASPEQIGALLDAARAMDDKTLEAKRATLLKEWAQTIMPGIVARLNDPQFQEQQVSGVLRQLLTYERGQLLVQAKQEAMVAR